MACKLYINVIIVVLKKFEKRRIHEKDDMHSHLALVALNALLYYKLTAGSCFAAKRGGAALTRRCLDSAESKRRAKYITTIISIKVL